MLNISFVFISPYLVAIIYIDDYNVHTYLYISLQTEIDIIQIFRLQNVTVNCNEQIHMEIYAI